MVITSKNETPRLLHFRSTQFRYAVTYIIITAIVLLLLNIYCSQISRESIFNSKETSMVEKCKLAAGKIADLEALNSKTVANAISDFEGMNVTRLIITDHNAQAIFDSNSAFTIVGKYVLFPEIVTALKGNDVFYSNYRNGLIQSIAVIPVYSYGTQIACIYMMENDTAQGTLIATLQNSIFAVTLTLEMIVILFSFLFTNTYFSRLRKIMALIKNVRLGDYSNKLELPGRDELNTLSDEFNDLISRLQMSENIRNQFVSDASHELKTPLASIKLLSDSILQNNTDLKTTREFVTDIGNEADRLNRMSQKLLTLSRADIQLEHDCKIIYIAPTINRVVRMLSTLAYSKQVEIELHLDKDCTARVLEDDLYQIIFNLVENGIKYNTVGGKLVITLKQKVDKTDIIIQDTGVGIPSDSLDHIFERFYRVDKARSRSTGGSGLGLSIVRSFVERNHGHISVESTLSKGSIFIVSFPILPDEEKT